MRRPLLTAPPVAAALAIVCWAALLGMALWVRDTRDPMGPDEPFARWLYAHTGSAVQHATLAFTDPLLTVGGCAAVTVCALLVRRWNLAVLASVGPLVGLGLESYVLKPSIDRRFGISAEQGYAFPSGHETGLTSLTTLLVVVLLTSGARRGVKLGLSAVAVLWTLLGAVGLVRNGYHYVTDTFGGIALGVGVMLSLALLLDAATQRFSSPAGPGRARTAPAA